MECPVLVADCINYKAAILSKAAFQFGR